MSWLNRILLALFIVGAVALLPRYEGVGSEDLARVQKERTLLRDENEALRQEIANIEAEVSGLRRGPRELQDIAAVDREVARIAREDLNLVRAGEFVFEIERPVAAKNGKRRAR